MVRVRHDIVFQDGDSLQLFDLSSETAKLQGPDFAEVQVVDIRRKKEFGHAGVEDALHLIFVMGHIPPVDIVQVALIGMQDEFDAHSP